MRCLLLLGAFVVLAGVAGLLLVDGVLLVARLALRGLVCPFPNNTTKQAGDAGYFLL